MFNTYNNHVLIHTETLDKKRTVNVHTQRISRICAVRFDNSSYFEAWIRDPEWESLPSETEAGVKEAATPTTTSSLNSTDASGGIAPSTRARTTTTERKQLKKNGVRAPRHYSTEQKALESFASWLGDNKQHIWGYTTTDSVVRLQFMFMRHNMHIPWYWYNVHDVQTVYNLNNYPTNNRIPRTARRETLLNIVDDVVQMSCNHIFVTNDTVALSRAVSRYNEEVNESHNSWYSTLGHVGVLTLLAFASGISFAYLVVSKPSGQ